MRAHVVLSDKRKEGGEHLGELGEQRAEYVRDRDHKVLRGRDEHQLVLGGLLRRLVSLVLIRVLSAERLLLQDMCGDGAEMLEVYDMAISISPHSTSPIHLQPSRKRGPTLLTVDAESSRDGLVVLRLVHLE